MKEEELRKRVESGELRYKTTWKDFVGFIFWGVMCMFLPLIASQLEALSFLADVPTVEIPEVVTYPLLVLVIVFILLEAYNFRLRIKKGGLGSEDNTVVLLREGTYEIVRHPSNVDGTAVFVIVSVILSRWIPFTILTIIGDVILIASMYYLSWEEEKFNLKKWGDKYRRYMKEVPRFNFILGLWRWGKRKRKQK